jgi:hypothetical protein
VPVTPCLDSGRHNGSSIIGCSADEHSSGESDAVQQQQQSTAVQLVPPTAAVCEGSKEMKKQSGLLQRAAMFFNCMALELTF